MSESETRERERAKNEKGRRGENLGMSRGCPRESGDCSRGRRWTCCRENGCNERIRCKLRETKPPPTQTSERSCVACSCSAQFPPCVVVPAGGGAGAAGASVPLPVAPVRAPVNPLKSCLPASAIWLVKSLTPDATEPFPVIPRLPSRSPVKLLKLLAKVAPSWSKGLASSPVYAIESSSLFRDWNSPTMTTTPAMITRPMQTSRTVCVTIAQVWHLVLP
mmetsp:Transcript_5223/g.15699  ORF Transcript_5223/g.15699 Transcript_5223/m.15699 type:complete len:220 (+) Transcript_5223:218-877(+)